MAHFIFPYLFIFIILGTVLGQILPDITTCGSLVGDISAALNEIVNMATIAGEAVSQMAGAPPSNPTQMLSVADRQVLFNTANAFFGVGDADGFARMVQVQGNHSILLSPCGFFSFIFVTLINEIQLFCGKWQVFEPTSHGLQFTAVIPLSIERAM